ncbi:hypothetical protein Z947_1892 [Sulfitobacter geojensis]|nr:hypothetical protein Z947_1892 [Sulfitobacter geojensis]
MRELCVHYRYHRKWGAISGAKTGRAAVLSVPVQRDFPGSIDLAQ